MNTQALIEVVLDRWVTSTDLGFIRENYRAFYNDPMGHRELVGIICNELSESEMTPRVYAF